jgi:uncharacterized protein YllA (UPF0747 family)
MQLLPLFQHYKVFFPVVLLRQSVQFIDKPSYTLMQKLGLDDQPIFENETTLTKHLITKNSIRDWTVATEQATIQKTLATLAQKAKDIDATLEHAVGAVITKINHQIVLLEKKMYRAEKRKADIDIARLGRLKEQLFPNAALQERVDNFMDFYLIYGSSFFDLLKDAILPIENKFVVLKE